MPLASGAYRYGGSRSCLVICYWICGAIAYTFSCRLGGSLEGGRSCALVLSRFSQAGGDPKSISGHLNSKPPLAHSIRETICSSPFLRVLERRGSPSYACC